MVKGKVYPFQLKKDYMCAKTMVAKVDAQYVSENNVCKG